jgi:hypothetical protein
LTVFQDPAYGLVMMNRPATTNVPAAQERPAHTVCRGMVRPVIGTVETTVEKPGKRQGKNIIEGPGGLAL